MNLTSNMDYLVFGIAVSCFAVLIFRAICMAVKEYKENKRKWWLK